MANKFQVKRTTTSGRTPNTTNSGNTMYIDSGELALNLADGKLFTSNGAGLVEFGTGTPVYDSTGTLITNSYMTYVAMGALATNVVPATDNLLTLGQNSYRFADGFFAGNLFIGNTSVNTSISPSQLSLGGSVVANGSTGSAGQVLTSGGAGANAYWSTVSGGGGGSGTPGGSNTQVQFNDSGAFGGNAGFVYNKVTNTLYVGANVATNTTAMSIGNSTVNSVLSATLLTVADSTATANITPLALTVGTSVVNTTVLAAGANVIANTSALYVGNSTVNTVVNQVGLTTGNSVVNTTTVAVGANVVLNTSTVTVGNSTVNATVTSTQYQVANSTGTANLTPTSLTINTSVVNSTVLAAGANVVVNTSAILIGNSTINTTTTATQIQIANSTSTINVNPIGIAVGTSVVNSTAVAVGADVVLNTSAISLGNTTVNTLVTSNGITFTNNSRLRIKTLNGSAVSFVQQNDDNFVFYSTNTTSGERPVYNIYANSDTSSLSILVPLTITQPLTANGATGTAGQVLTSNGTTGSPYWSTVSGGGGGGTPTGSNTYIQFNDSGAFGGDAGLTYDKDNDIVSVGNSSVNTTISPNSSIMGGDVRVVGNSAIHLGGTRSTSVFYIQYNASNNSIDFMLT